MNNLDGFHRVTEIVHPDNTPSIRLLKSLHFKQEGHFIENCYVDGKWESELQYAMLKKQWEEIKLTLT